MNAWATLVLGGLLLRTGLEMAADGLNLRALAPEAPPELRGVYDAERYRRSQAYVRARTRFGLLAAAIDLLVLLVFWFAGGFARLDNLVRGLDLGPVATGLLFLGALGLGSVLLDLPVRWWSTFVIEERFGFNRTTPRTFWTDLAKGLVLGAALGGALLAAVLWLFTTAGRPAWLWCWLVSAVFVVGVEYVAPTWLMPLFNRFTPLPTGELRDALLAYARAAGFPLENVYVIDGSRRSTKANAFFTGFGRHRRAALFDTLVDTLTTREVVAVLAHEIGHYRLRHVVTSTILAITHLGAAFFLFSAVMDRPGLFEAFFLEEPSVHAALVFFALLVAPIEIVLAVGLNALSRRHEFDADTFAARTTGSGEPLAQGLERLSADSLSNLTPHPFYVALHYSHPPLRARLRALRR